MAGQAVRVVAVLRARARGAAEACARKDQGEECTRARQQQVSRCCRFDPVTRTGGAETCGGVALPYHARLIDARHHIA